MHRRTAISEASDCQAYLKQKSDELLRKVTSDEFREYNYGQR